MNNTINVKHMANVGDVWASLAGMKKYFEIRGEKIVWCQQVDVPGTYYDGAIHPVVDEKGVQVMCNRQMFDMMKPLLLSQEYIADVQEFSGQQIKIDLDVIRGQVNVNMPHQAIQQWIFMAFPDIAADLSKPWIHINEDDVDLSQCKIMYSSAPTIEFGLPTLSDKVILNFTERYRNHRIDYFFLKQFEPRLIFSGTEKEYNLFCDRWQLNVPYLKINNFLELAAITKKAKFTMCNQSALWNLCESQKTPRLLELCQYAPNCQAFIGEDSYGFMHQVGAKYYFETLMNKK